MKKAFIFTIFLSLISLSFCSKPENNINEPTIDEFQILTVLPENNATDIKRDTFIQITFNHPCDTLSAMHNFHLMVKNDTIHGTFQFENERKILKFYPNSLLPPNDTLIIHIGKEMMADTMYMRMKGMHHNMNDSHMKEDFNSFFITSN